MKSIITGEKRKISTREKGITLIALVVTIIVLLILAGVSIQMLTGQNGILKRAQEASEKTKEATAKEIVGLAVMDSIDEKGNFNVEKFKELIGTQTEKVVEDGEILSVEIEGYEIEVDGKTGKIKDIQKAGGVKAKFDIVLYQTNGEKVGTGTTYEELVLTVKVTNIEEIESKGGKVTQITVKAPIGEMIVANEVVTGDGDKSFKVNQKGIYTVTVETEVKGIKRTVVKEESTKGLIEIPEFSRAYGTIDIRFINKTENTATENQTANKPILGKNMKPVNLKSDNSGWEIVEEKEWNYNYTNSAGESKWANAVVTNEKGEITGYFVWIPRYAYKITYHDGSLEGETIGYSDSRGIVRKDENLERVYTGGDSNRRNAGENFIVHPAFTNDVNVGGWDKELQGIWVAKYEASGNISTEIKVLPGELCWRNNKIRDVYTASEKYNSTLNSHLMKNSEWGATAYLSYSNYGLGPNTPVAENIDNRFITGGSSTEMAIYTDNVGQSTTGNAYGVYDMNGGGSDYMASFINNGHENLETYGSSFATKNKKNAKSTSKVTVYKASNSETEEATDKQAINYQLSGENMFGDATFETSITGIYTGSGSWHSALAEFPCVTGPFFVRSGCTGQDFTGVFNFYRDDGSAAFISFYPVLAF